MRFCLLGALLLSFGCSSVELDPNVPRGFDLNGRWFLNAGLSDHPDPRALRARATLRILKSDWKGARKDLQEAIEADPLNAAFRFDLGRIQTGSFTIGGRADVDDDDFRGVSKFPDARENLGLATELAPENEYYRKFFERYLEK